MGCYGPDIADNCGEDNYRDRKYVAHEQKHELI